MSDAPTPAISNAPPAPQVLTVKDARGRTIQYQEMDPEGQFDLYEACGKMTANSAWLGLALLVCAARQIDAVPLPSPKDAAGVRRNSRLLGNDGIAALATALNPRPSADDENEDLEVAKN